ncbi:MAG: hypothetical protein J6S63_01315 [Atopobiaceae bacterium]|nr:hypothetical protein [Atopobiaceae bacterium]
MTKEKYAVIEREVFAATEGGRRTYSWGLPCGGEGNELYYGDSEEHALSAYHKAWIDMLKGEGYKLVKAARGLDTVEYMSLELVRYTFDEDDEDGCPLDVFTVSRENSLPWFVEKAMRQAEGEYIAWCRYEAGTWRNVRDLI